MFLNVDHFKVFIAFVTILLLLYALFIFGLEESRILTPQPSTKPEPCEFEGEVLTTGPPGKPLRAYILKRGHRWSLCSLG